MDLLTLSLALVIITLLGLTGWLVFQLLKLRRELKAANEAFELLAKAEAENTRLQQRVKSLAKYQHIVDIAAEAARIQQASIELSDKAKAQARQLLLAAKKKALAILQQADQRATAKAQQTDRLTRESQERIARTLQAAKDEASSTIKMANLQAEEIAGNAYAAIQRAKDLEATATALKNTIEGYGDVYIIPTYTLLDELAEDMSSTEAGQNLKTARKISADMCKEHRAATCEYVEAYRRQTAIDFVVDAFNGKVDSILSRTKADNYGKLAQQIHDACAMVNHLGTAFRKVRITDEYLEARLNELKWATIAQALKDEERERQRTLREQIREEEKAKREYERAQKAAAKEEATLLKAMEKARREVAAASDAQRAEFEAKLLALQEQLQAAEDKNKRALSMAQQTRAGHVYIISNLGSFGEHVFKIGMTRRLEPLDRVKELGDASVPFEFDVHAMIYSEDAPGLEKALHRHFIREQINKVNPRKEFFRLRISDIRKELEALGVNAQWTMTAAALEYRESQRIEQQIRENPAIAAEWTRVQEREAEEILATAEDE